MKIAFVGQKGIPATYGGIENFTENVATRLAKKGHQVVVYCRPHYTPDNGRYKQVILRKVYSINSKHLDALSHTFFCSLDVLGKDFDVITYQALGPASLCFIPRFGAKTKVVSIIHSLDWKRKKWNPLAKLCLKLAEFPSTFFPHKVAVVSEELKSYLEEKSGKKDVTHIPVGVEDPIFREPAKIKEFGLEKGKYILFLSRLVPEKGCHYLIEAFQNIPTDMKLFIAGDGKFSDDYLKRLHASKSDKIIFGGYVEKKLLEELFTNAYLYVLPSEIEGLPQTALQALSYGLCVLASDISENKEAIGSWGYTFKSRDVCDLGKHLERLIKNPNIVNHDREKRKSYVESRFSWDRTVEALEEIYGDL